MRCISLWQPWASLVITGEKRYETRSWRPQSQGLQIGDAVAIHAAKKWTQEEKDYCDSTPFKQRLAAHNLGVHNMPLGAVLGVCKLVSVLTSEEALEAITPLERAFGNYGRGRFAWELEVVHKFDKPILARGMQGVFHWDVPTTSDAQPPKPAAPGYPKTTVVNFRDVKHLWNPNIRQWGEPDLIYCGRRNTFYNLPQSDWHNPYKGDAAIPQFRHYIKHNLPLMDRIDELRGNRLVCWCAPDLCHCDVLCELLGEPVEHEQPEVKVSDQPTQARLF